MGWWRRASSDAPPPPPRAATPAPPPPPPTAPPPAPPVPLFGVPPPRPPLRNPGWDRRVFEGTLWSFAGGLGVGAMRAAYAEELNFAPAIAAFAGNAALVGAGFHLSREMTRLVRQRDDWINSCVGGAVAGSAVATAFRGRAYSPAGAAALAALATAGHLALDPDPSVTAGWMRLCGFRTVPKADGELDWVTPAWFPIRRVSDDELEANEIEFQMRVRAVLEGRVSAEDAEKVREEYRRRRDAERRRKTGEGAVEG